jgi:hypothetical protein
VARIADYASDDLADRVQRDILILDTGWAAFALTSETPQELVEQPRPYR